jgi:hypothetical protein
MNVPLLVVALEQGSDHYAKARTHALTPRPVNGHRASQALRQLNGDLSQSLVPELSNGCLVRGQRIVERGLVRAKTRRREPRIPNLRKDRTLVVSGEGHRREGECMTTTHRSAISRRSFAIGELGRRAA